MSESPTLVTGLYPPLPMSLHPTPTRHYTLPTPIHVSRSATAHWPTSLKTTFQSLPSLKSTLDIFTEPEMKNSSLQPTHVSTSYPNSPLHLIHLYQHLYILPQLVTTLYPPLPTSLHPTPNHQYTLPTRTHVSTSHPNSSLHTTHPYPCLYILYSTCRYTLPTPTPVPTSFPYP